MISIFKVIFHHYSFKSKHNHRTHLIIKFLMDISKKQNILIEFWCFKIKISLIVFKTKFIKYIWKFDIIINFVHF